MVRVTGRTGFGGDERRPSMSEAIAGRPAEEGESVPEPGSLSASMMQPFNLPATSLFTTPSLFDNTPRGLSQRQPVQSQQAEEE